MMLEAFKALHSLSNERVRLVLNDGREMIATLKEVSQDLTGRWYLAYHRVEWPLPPTVNIDHTVYRCSREELLGCDVRWRF
jgi:hypothetical protein